ncbi:MAG: hypothetical protein ACYTFG_18825 [Planctomycetota bacterium]|jgi:hypothetical protein
MTSINAIRFDEFSGAMCCDEQRHWNPERMKVFAVDKIRPVVSRELITRYRLAASYGNTGTSTVGEELRVRIREEVESNYREALETEGSPPETFLSMEDVARIAFSEQTALKHRHIDQQLKGRWGFTTSDLCRGYYMRDKDRIEIGSSEVSEAAEVLATWKERKGDSRAVFGNGGIVAGYSPLDGFRIFQFSMAEGFWAPADALFLALGSGLDTANLVFSEFAENHVPEGSGGIDRVEGAITIISAVNHAAKNNLGVGGYYNIILIDGREKKAERIFREINDHRSKLASEIVYACDGGHLSWGGACELIEGLLFGKETFEKTLKAFHGGTKSAARLKRFLRGYRS